MTLFRRISFSNTISGLITIFGNWGKIQALPEWIHIMSWKDKGYFSVIFTYMVLLWRKFKPFKQRMCGHCRWGHTEAKCNFLSQLRCPYWGQRRTRGNGGLRPRWVKVEDFQEGSDQACHVLLAWLVADHWITQPGDIVPMIETFLWLGWVQKRTDGEVNIPSEDNSLKLCSLFVIIPGECQWDILWPGNSLLWDLGVIALEVMESQGHLWFNHSRWCLPRKLTFLTVFLIWMSFWTKMHHGLQVQS